MQTQMPKHISAQIFHTHPTKRRPYLRGGQERLELLQELVRFAEVQEVFALCGDVLAPRVVRVLRAQKWMRKYYVSGCAMDTNANANANDELLSNQLTGTEA